MFQYKVATFVPTVAGCGATETGWDAERCRQFEEFLNDFARDGWRLCAQEFRNVVVTAGCGKNQGAVLVCTFERPAA